MEVSKYLDCWETNWFVIHNTGQASRVRSSLSDIDLLLKTVEERSNHHTEISSLFLRVGEGNQVCLILWNIVLSIPLSSSLKILQENARNPITNASKMLRPRFCLKFSSENLYFACVFYPKPILHYLLNLGWANVSKWNQGNTYEDAWFGRMFSKNYVYQLLK